MKRTTGILLGKKWRRDFSVDPLIFEFPFQFKLDFWPFRLFSLLASAQRHCNIEGNEIGDRLAKLGIETSFTGPEPFLKFQLHSAKVLSRNGSILPSVTTHPTPG